MEGATPPNYVTRAYAFDTSWMSEAACRGHNTPGSPFQHAWTTDDETLTEVALTFCAMCPVQWTCVSWAIDVEERVGTWGVRWDDLEWLRAQRHPRQIVNHARHYEVPIQVAVRRRRQLTVTPKVGACT